MALAYSGDPVPDVKQMFMLAQDAEKPEDIGIRLHVQAGLREQIVDTAEYLVENVADSRERSIALTHLETALLYMGKAIFK